jgi:transglutaminase-like putative cysteine protease
VITEVRWSSQYEYGADVHLLHNELRVLPAPAAGQRVLEESITIEPSGAVLELTDAFGNRYQHTSALTATGTLDVVAMSLVDTTSEPAEARITPMLDHLMRQPTARAPFDPRIERLDSNWDQAPLALARELSGRISAQFEYAQGFTDAESTAADLLDGGRGVCQDFAHLLLASLRSHGVVARYVSGYLVGDDASAMHAWVQVADEGRWHGLDPANGTEQSDHYVFVASGRDYDDVAPIRGTYAGDASHLWRAEVHARGAEQ